MKSPTCLFLALVACGGVIMTATASSANALPTATCLAYDDLVDHASMTDFDFKLYEGLWYVASTNEPTEPAFCRCDIFNWTLTSPTEFLDTDTTTCGSLPPTALKLKGTLSADPDPSRVGWLREGMPPLFALIDNFILYVETDSQGLYNATIRYSCEENYNVPTPPFHFKLFESIQIWTREKISSQSTLDRLFGVAVDMGIINPSSFDTYKNLTYEGC